MKIGKLHIGYRKHDSHRWKEYLLPKAYNSDRYYRHHYYKFYYRWLNFFWCMPRKCDCCKKYLSECGGTRLYSYQLPEFDMIVCKTCLNTREYTDAKGVTYRGSQAWLHEAYDAKKKKEKEKDNDSIYEP